MNGKAHRWLLGALLLCGALSATADDVVALQDPALQARYLRLTHTLRCPKCENQAIDSSTAPVAIDMRRYVATGLLQGQSDQHIQDELVSRFGEYVLYAPRLSARTFLLWLGPVILTGIAVCMVVITVLSRHRPAHIKPLDPDEEALLTRVLLRHKPTGRERNSP